MVWHDPEEFDCNVCAQKPALKDKLGCGGGVEWSFPQDLPRVTIDRCPVKYISSDIVGLGSMLFLAGGSISIDEQMNLPPPVLDALTAIRSEQEQRRKKALDRWKK